MKHCFSSSLDKEELRRRLGLPQGVLCTYTGKLSRAKGLVMLFGSLLPQGSAARVHRP